MKKGASLRLTGRRDEWPKHNYGLRKRGKGKRLVTVRDPKPESQSLERDSGKGDALSNSQDLLCANAALAYHNKQNKDAEFELVEAITSNVLYNANGLWFHSNFTAKPKDGDQTPKHFFAELSDPEDSSHAVFVCQCHILDPINSVVIAGCGGCNPFDVNKVLHPLDGFDQGRFHVKWRPYHWDGKEENALLM